MPHTTEPTAYVGTLATVTNSDGETVTVAGPSIPAWGLLTADWIAGYRPLALEMAVDAGLTVYPQGMRVSWRRVALEEA
ncbi:hypothetical protein [Microbacterium sp. zg-YB36]|uniref:hypothetical protein n=1 Tax=Microbacterium sp. zg-YB36 TaxID=2969407 RepID=UPI00214B14A4|nr:hypothetical protein [Microbacterium sp. zg-YB36]MDL5351164.1 hypothetical protein [Microbacterium sp. zg-YB36]